jgi:hypothetical protein
MLNGRTRDVEENESRLEVPSRDLLIRTKENYYEPDFGAEI